MWAWTLYILILLSVSGVSGSWEITCPNTVKSVSGACAVLPCSFTYPSNVEAVDGTHKFWYKDYSSNQKVVYHPTDSVDAAFLGRVDFVGEPVPKNCTVVIKNLQTSDAGTFQFRFEIINKDRWLDKTGVQLEVTDDPLAPEVVVPPQINEGSSVTFQCSTPYFCPDGSVSLDWMDYPSEQSSLSFTVQMDTEAVLFTKNLTSSFSWKDHQKKIRCEVTIGEKKAMREITLDVTHPPKGVKLLLHPSGRNLKEDETVILTCQVNSSHPSVTGYTWHKDGQKVSNERILTFHSLSRSDHGEYQCEAENSLGRASSDPFQLVIFSARILVSPSQDVEEGSSVTLTCELPGTRPDDIHYSWFKNNNWIRDSSVASLRFPRVSIGDAGYYYCKVQNDRGSDASPPVIIDVKYPPRTPSLSSFMETLRGNLAMIDCTVESNPSSELSLYKDGNLIGSSSSHSTPSERVRVTSTGNSLRLKIEDVTLSDEGLYRCDAENSMGNSSASLQLTVETARVMIAPSPEAEEGEEVTLTCMATRGSEEGTTYSWYKNSKQLKAAVKRKELVLHRLTTMDAGSYFCKAQSSRGSSTSPPVTLHVLFPPRDLSLNSLVSSQGILQASIHCTVASDPPSQILLYHGRTLVASSTNVISNKRYEVSSSPNALKLEILDVVLEDEGQYICLANNSYGQMSGTLHLTADTAKIIMSPPGEVREGDGVNLTCYLKTLSKDQNYSYSWYKDHVLQGEGSLLQIPQVSSLDSGLYYCKAWSNESSKSSAGVSLEVNYAPRRLQVTSFQDTAEGTSAFIRCSVDSFPLAEMSLYREDQLVASSRYKASERYQVTSSRNELNVNIKPLRLEDEGKYNCTCRNGVGSASQTVHFSVQTARVLVSPSTEVLEGSRVTLACNLMKPQLEDMEIIWYKNSRWFKKTAENSLVLDPVEETDSGYYHCVVQGAEDHGVSPSIFLHVSYGPRTPLMSSFWAAQGGQTGIIQCSVDSDPPSRLALYFRGLVMMSSDAHGSPRGRIRVTSSPNAIKMEIGEVRLEDEGTYLCVANNSIGESRATANFTAQTTRVVISPSSVVQEGQAATLACVVDTDAASAATYTWYKNGVRYSEGSVNTLQFTHVDSEDGGAFYCSVQMHHGNKSSPSVILDVLYPPKNVNLKSFLDTEHGKAAIFLGSADSNPPSELSLYKDGRLLASSSDGGRSSSRRIRPYFSPDLLRLEITDLTSADRGSYLFTAQNPLGTSHASANFTVEDVRVLVCPAGELREGRIATLTCEVLAGPEDILGYTWYKNSRWFREVPSSSLGLGGVSSRDAGSYACSARTPTGSRTSAPASLSVLYPPRNLSLTAFLELEGRQRGVIVCTVDSHPASQMHLLKGEETLASSGLRGATQRPGLSSSHNTLRLEIGDITTDDRGVYTCQAQNSLGTVGKSITFTAQSARLKVAPSEEIHEGRSVTLTCEVPRMENITYTWYKNNKWLHDGPEKMYELYNVTSSETGSYHCLANHRRGNRSSPLVGISVLYGPKSLVISSFLETHERNGGIIFCSVDSHPPSTMEVYKDNILLGSSASTQANRGHKYSTSTLYNYLRLEIRDFNARDCGSYVCRASNRLGTASSSIDVSITDSESPAFKVISWLAIICVLFLVSTIIVILYRQRNTKKCLWSAEEEEEPMEMARKEASQASLSSSTVGLSTAEHRERGTDYPGVQDSAAATQTASPSSP